MKILKIISWRYRDFLQNKQIFSTASLIKYYIALLSGKKLMKVNVKGVKQPILIRVKNKIDRNVLMYVFFQKYHLPPPEMQLKNDAVILDFGSNIGCTMVDFIVRYPTAKVYGYEMHPNNFEIAKANICTLDGVKIYNEAVWTHKGFVSFSKKNLSDAFAISKDTINENESINIPSVSIADIIATNNLAAVDFIKMDIEGAELDIFDHSDLNWLNKVLSMNIEFHNIDEIKLKQYINLLEQYHFKVYKSPHHWLSLLAYKMAE